jgi:hypothetical protein
MTACSGSSTRCFSSRLVAQAIGVRTLRASPWSIPRWLASRAIGRMSTETPRKVGFSRPADLPQLPVRGVEAQRLQINASIARRKAYRSRPLATGGRSSKPNHSRMSAGRFTDARDLSPIQAAVWSPTQVPPKSPDLSLPVVGRRHCCTTARGPSKPACPAQALTMLATDRSVSRSVATAQDRGKRKILI